MLSLYSVVISLIIQLVYTIGALTSGDPTFNIWRAIIPQQAAQTLSIITASTIYLKPFVDSLQSGFWQAGDMRRRQDSRFGFEADHSTGKSPSATKRHLRWSPKRNYPSNSSQYNEIELQRPKTAKKKDMGYSANAGQAELPPDFEESGRLQIMQTSTWAVEQEQL